MLVRSKDSQIEVPIGSPWPRGASCEPVSETLPVEFFLLDNKDAFMPLCIIRSIFFTRSHDRFQQRKVLGNEECCALPKVTFITTYQPVGSNRTEAFLIQSSSLTRIRN